MFDALQYVEIDCNGIVHQFSVVFAGKDVTGASHISRQLIDFVKIAIDELLNVALITQICQDELISVSFIECRILKVNSANPKSFIFETLYQMVTDKSTGAAYQGGLDRSCLHLTAS
jgi:hypothetical protein